MSVMTESHPLVMSSRAISSDTGAALADASTNHERIVARLDDAHAALAVAQREATAAVATTDPADDVKAVLAVSEARSRVDALAAAVEEAAAVKAHAQARHDLAKRGHPFAVARALTDESAAAAERLDAAVRELTSAFFDVRKPYDEALRTIAPHTGYVKPHDTLLLVAKTLSALKTAGCDLDLKGFPMPTTPVYSIAHGVRQSIADLQDFMITQGYAMPEAAA